MVFPVCTCTIPLQSALLHSPACENCVHQCLFIYLGVGGSFLVPFMRAFVPTQRWAHTRSVSPLHSSSSVCPFGACLVHAHLQSVPSLPHTTPALRCEPVMALPSHICCWALTCELKGPLFLMVALSPAGACHLSHRCSCKWGTKLGTCSSSQKRKRWAFSRLARERQTPLKPVSCAWTPGFSQGKGWLCKNSGVSLNTGMFFTPNIQGMG